MHVSPPRSVLPTTGAYRASLLTHHLVELERRLAPRAHTNGSTSEARPTDELVERVRADIGIEIDKIRVALDGGCHAGVCELLSRIRALYSLAAGVEGAPEWHSPPLSATRSMDAEPGPVLTDHDYQRDRSGPVGDYETAWLDTVVGAGQERLRALAFGSGMAAMSTILLWLGGQDRPIIAAPDLYRETRFLLQGVEPLVRVPDDSSIEALLALASDSGECTVVLDAQSNDHRLAVKDWPHLLRALSTSTSDVTVVIDVTLLSVSCRPFELPIRAGVRVITVESITKFGQLGLDRVAGGVAVADGRTAAGLDRWREHAGTGLTVSAVRQLPRPCSATMNDRFGRHQRNAARLAHALDADLSGLGLTVIHPSLTGHSDHQLATALASTGSLVTVSGLSGAEAASWAERTMDRALDSGVRLAQGTSFGLDATRLAVIAEGPTPYLRLAAGDGSLSEIDAVAEVVTACA